MTVRLPRLRPRSLKYKLALVFFAITALAFSAIYFAIVPQLRSDLEKQRLRDLRREAGVYAPPLRSTITQEIPARDLDQLVRSVADSSGAEITLLGVQRSQPTPSTPPFFVISNSHAGRQVDVSRWLAASAFRTRRVQTAVANLRGTRSAQAAVPLREPGRAPVRVAVFTRALDDVHDTVSLVRTRVLVAGAAAMLIALIGGYLVARALARRVRRLELAADKVAAGSFVDPIPVDSDDELGQLARSFSEMQRRLGLLDRARKEFIANASHELRTPIFSLGGFVELLEDEELDADTQREFIHSMREQVDRLQKLAVDLLDLSRIDAGSLELGVEEVDLSELARDVLGEFRPAVSHHRTRLALELPRGEVEALCDRERVAQIMRILLDNALTHTPQGTLVTVSANRDNGAAEFTVADTGPGVRSDAPAQVFERFYTADAARGSGLGLAIAQELAGRMSGRITLHSEPGGTAFTLALPAAEPGGREAS